MVSMLETAATAEAAQSTPMSSASLPRGKRLPEFFCPEIPTPDRTSAVNGRSDRDHNEQTRAYHTPAIGFQQFLTEEEGSGYWESSRFNEHFSLTVIDVKYRQRRWIQVVGWRFFKLRLLLDGQLLGAKGEVLATGPQAILHLSPGTCGDGYFIAGGLQTKLIVLNCRAEMLQDTLGLDADSLPSLFKGISSEDHASSSHRIGFSSAARHAGQCIFDARHGVPSALRAAYLNSMSVTILCEVFGELVNRDLVRRSASGLAERDLNRIYEVRDYLTQRFTAPPTIPQLARMVGINQSKLKADFKKVFGVTIYQYIVERRMELASELLLNCGHSVSEVAYRVGYEYPTNFTFAFKRYFGCLPREWRTSEAVRGSADK